MKDKRLSFMLYIIVFFLSIFVSHNSYATSICAENGIIYDDDMFCNASCNNQCSPVNLNPAGSTGTCNKANYRGFIYYNDKTYAITVNDGFWTDFNNLATIDDANINTALMRAINYYGFSSGWIGLYDPNRSTAYDIVDPSRFVWVDARLRDYSNWASGEPNNKINSDDAEVSILGEHWVLMTPDGFWRDSGYHKDVNPNTHAIVMWTGALDCVNAIRPPESNSTTSTDVISTLCTSGSTCYVCGNTDINDNNIQKCINVTVGSSTKFLCPLDMMQCVNTTTYIYKDPSCSSGTTYNASTGKCETNISYSGTVSASKDGWIFAVGFQGTNLRTSFDHKNYTYSGYINIYGSGSTISGNRYVTKLWVETNNGSIRLVGYDILCGYTYSNWVSWDSDFSITAAWNCNENNGDVWATDEALFQKQGNQVRVCMVDLWNTSCSSWANIASCPSGFTLNSSTKKCEASPTYCSSGTYDPNVKKCVIATTVKTCPAGSGYECIPYNNNYYCSVMQCVDASSAGSYIDEDTAQGANDQKDGGFEQDGTCKGTISIFAGQDKRCRPKCVSTGFSDCCKKTKTWFGLGKCNADEQVLAKMRTTYLNKDYTAADANCHYVGEYCAKKIKFIGCITKKRTFCCFSSPLARIIHEQGRPQFNISWGTPKSPNCRGFTIEEFQMLDFSKIDLTEWIQNYIEPEVRKQVNENMKNQLDNVKNTLPQP